MLTEEPLHPQEAFVSDPNVVAPSQDERTSPLATDPVADLVTYDNPQDTKRYSLAQSQCPVMDQETGGDEYGLARERYSDTLQHHPEENEQVPVLSDQREDLVHGLHEACLDGPSGTFFPGL